MSPTSASGGIASFLCSHAAMRAVLGAFLVALVFFKVVVLDRLIVKSSAPSVSESPHPALRMAYSRPVETEAPLNVMIAGAGPAVSESLRIHQQLQQQVQVPQQPSNLGLAPVRLDAGELWLLTFVVVVACLLAATIAPIATAC